MPYIRYKTYKYIFCYLCTFYLQPLSILQFLTKNGKKQVNNYQGYEKASYASEASTSEFNLTILPSLSYSVYDLLRI